MQCRMPHCTAMAAKIGRREQLNGLVQLIFISRQKQKRRDRRGRSETKRDRERTYRVRIILKQIEGVIGLAPLSALSPHFAGH